MNKCRHCKKEFLINDLFSDCKREYKGKITRYYTCNPCNTARCKKYRKTEIGRLNINKAVYKSIKKYPKKQKARILLNKKIREGLIIRPNLCEKCNNISYLEGHHFNYNKPLEVMWLCKKCHTKI